MHELRAQGLTLVSHNVIYHLLDQIRGIMEGEKVWEGTRVFHIAHFLKILFILYS